MAKYSSFNGDMRQETRMARRSFMARPFSTPLLVGALVMMTMLACEDDDEDNEGTAGAAGAVTGGEAGALTGGEAGALTGGEAGAVSGGQAGEETGGQAGEETGGTAGVAGAVTAGEAGARTGGRGGQAGEETGGTAGVAGAVTGGQGGAVTGGEAGALTGGTSGQAGEPSGGTAGAAPAGGAAGSPTGGAAGAATDPFALSPRCTSGTTWTSGFNARMRPGEACIACHDAQEGPSFSAAGTVYPTGHEPDDCNGLSNSDAVVVITDDGNAEHEVAVNEVGNFMLSTAINLPYTAKVVVGAVEREMVSSQSSGDCNDCHTQDGRNGAPGRVVLP